MTGGWLPWSGRLAPGGGCPTRPPLRVAADRHGRGPEEHGRFRPDGYSGLRRVRVPARGADAAGHHHRPADEPSSIAAGVARHRCTARTRARGWCGRGRTGPPPRPRTRSPTTWASSRVGWPVSTRWAESARTSLERLQTCRSWTSATPGTAVMAARRSARSTSDGVDSRRTSTLARTSRTAWTTMSTRHDERRRRVEAVARRRRPLHEDHDPGDQHDERRPGRPPPCGRMAARMLRSPLPLAQHAGRRAR